MQVADTWCRPRGHSYLRGRRAGVHDPSTCAAWLLRSKINRALAWSSVAAKWVAVNTSW